MAARGLVVGGRAEHAAELGEALLALDQAHDRLGRALADVALLGDGELALGEGRDLRQMGDAEDLAALGQRRQPLAERRRRDAADARCRPRRR